MILRSSHNAIFSQGLEVGVMPYDSPGYQMTLDFGLDHVHVKPSLSQESKKDLMMKDTSGQFSQNSLKSANLQSFLESRLKQQLNTDGSILFKMTWKSMATPAHRRYCLLRALAHRTSDTGFIGGGVLANASKYRGERKSDLEQDRTESLARSCNQGNGNSQSIQLERETLDGIPHGKEGREVEGRHSCESSDADQQLAHPDCFGCRGRYSESGLRTESEGFPINIKEQLLGHFDFWSGAEWRLGQDGKVRPVEPGTFPLAYGIPARVGRLRGYGNAIVPQVAAEFIKAFLGAKDDMAFER